ncbi:MAG: hypothetical protein ACYTBJ_11360 [Planctomycetota bacterium]
MKWNVKDKQNIGYCGGPMCSNEYGYLKFLVEAHGIEHVFLLSLSLMGEEYRKETMEVIILSHEYFKELYLYPMNVESNPSLDDVGYGGIVYVIQEYGYDHLYHYLLLFVKDDEISSFVETILPKVGEFRKQHDSLYPVKEKYPHRQNY